MVIRQHNNLWGFYCFENKCSTSCGFLQVRCAKLSTYKFCFCSQSHECICVEQTLKLLKLLRIVKRGKLLKMWNRHGSCNSCNCKSQQRQKKVPSPKYMSDSNCVMSCLWTELVACFFVIYEKVYLKLRHTNKTSFKHNEIKSGINFLLRRLHF